nr:uncharacterized protein LOC125181528 [Anser cygnoides]
MLWGDSALWDPGDLGGSALHGGGRRHRDGIPAPLPSASFLMHMASSCPLVANGSVMGFDFTLAFKKNQLVCYDSDTQRFVACDWGLLRLQATHLAAHLNNDSTWVQRVEAWRQACSDLALCYWDWTALRHSEPPGGLGVGPWCGNAVGEYCLGSCVGVLQSMLHGGIARGCCRAYSMGALHGDSRGVLQRALHGRIAPSQTRCRGAENKDAQQALLASLQHSGDRAEAHGAPTVSHQVERVRGGHDMGPQRAKCALGCLRHGTAGRPREGIVLLCSACCEHSSTACSCGHHSRRRA